MGGRKSGKGSQTFLLQESGCHQQQPWTVRKTSTDKTAQEVTFESSSDSRLLFAELNVQPFEKATAHTRTRTRTRTRTLKEMVHVWENTRKTT